MNKINRTISQIWEDNYVVPIYQRNYAWGEDQITQLLQDIYDASQNEGSLNFQNIFLVSRFEQSSKNSSHAREANKSLKKSSTSGRESYDR